MSSSKMPGLFQCSQTGRPGDRGFETMPDPEVSDSIVLHSGVGTSWRARKRLFRAMQGEGHTVDLDPGNIFSS